MLFKGLDCSYYIKELIIYEGYRFNHSIILFFLRERAINLTFNNIKNPLMFLIKIIFCFMNFSIFSLA